MNNGLDRVEQLPLLVVPRQLSNNIFSGLSDGQMALPSR